MDAVGRSSGKFSGGLRFHRGHSLRQHCAELVSLIKHRRKATGGKNARFHNESEPIVGLSKFLQSQLELVGEILSRFPALRFLVLRSN